MRHLHTCQRCGVQWDCYRPGACWIDECGVCEFTAREAWAESTQARFEQERIVREGDEHADHCESQQRGR